MEYMEKMKLPAIFVVVLTLFIFTPDAIADDPKARAIMEKVDTRTVHKTILKLNNVNFNQDLSEELFTTRRLEKGL